MVGPLVVCRHQEVVRGRSEPRRRRPRAGPRAGPRRAGPQRAAAAAAQLLRARATAAGTAHSTYIRALCMRHDMPLFSINW